MKITIISDIHANIFGLKTVFSSLPQVDKILCAGDITGYYPFVNEVINELKDRDVICVKGNHDQYLINGKAPDNSKDTISKSVERMKDLITPDNLEFIKSLPNLIEMEIDGRKVFMCHGSPWDNLEERIYPDYSDFDKFNSILSNVIILGHTHYPMIKNVGDKIVLNPGSCGQPRDYNLLSYIIWDTESNNFTNHRLEWDIKEFEEEAMKRGVEDDLFEVFKRVKK